MKVEGREMCKTSLMTWQEMEKDEGNEWYFRPNVDF